MLKEFVEKIAEMAENKEHKIDGRTYMDKPVHLVDEERYAPNCHTVSTLYSLAALIRAEIKKVEDQLPIIVEVENPHTVSVFTTYDDRYKRKFLYQAKADVPQNSINRWEDKQNTIIQLNSVYEQSKDRGYLLNLLSVMTEESKVTETDNGLTQAVEANKGISLKQNIDVRPRVSLKPFRTFVEVEQPESEFTLRVKEGGQVLISEADGGRWKLDAKKNAAEFLKKELFSLGNKVIITI